MVELKLLFDNCIYINILYLHFEVKLLGMESYGLIVFKKPKMFFIFKSYL